MRAQGTMKQTIENIKKENKNKEKGAINKSLQLAQQSTASMGKFDRKLNKEPQFGKIKNDQQRK